MKVEKKEIRRVAIALSCVILILSREIEEKNIYNNKVRFTTNFSPSLLFVLDGEINEPANVAWRNNFNKLRILVIWKFHTAKHVGCWKLFFHGIFVCLLHKHEQWVESTESREREKLFSYLPKHPIYIFFVTRTLPWW